MDQDSGNHAVVVALRSSGIDVLTAEEAGQKRLTDPEQLSFANEAGRAIVTANLIDFARLHSEWTAAGRVHSGIIVRRNQQMSIGDQIRTLLSLAAAFGALSLANRFEYLEAWIPSRP